MGIKQVFWSWDFILSLSFSLILWIILPFWADNQFAIKLYDIGISVLSIIFSVFFAALAIIISSSDNDFVQFLEEEGDYTKIINSFKFSLLILFFALICSISLSGITAYWANQGHKNQPNFLILLFCFLFLYALFVTLGSTLDSIKYSKCRIKFLTITSKIKRGNNDY